MLFPQTGPEICCHLEYFMALKRDTRRFIKKIYQINDIYAD